MYGVYIYFWPTLLISSSRATARVITQNKDATAADTRAPYKGARPICTPKRRTRAPKLGATQNMDAKAADIHVRPN